MKIILILIIFFPLSLQSQVVFCNKYEIKKTTTDRWERVNYGLRIFEFNDSTILRETIHVLSLSHDVDSIHIKSENVKEILVMWFKEGCGDTVTCRARYSEKPFVYDELKGCCLISGYYVQLAGTIPSFMTPTKDIATFSYLSHMIVMGNYDGFIWEMEEMGDDSIPQWNIEYFQNKVRLINYYGY
ncbi:MAG: hypothetical protein K5864_03600 [Bacteroidales bacterium]|nr:hypothetical protein [Bacteroidales bacterium]